MSQPSVSESLSGETSRYLVFSLDKEQFAIPLLNVKEVIAYPEITSVPYTPSHFLGITNLRGQVISVMDLRLKLGIKAERKEDTAVIICDLAPLCVGIVVNSVNSVLSLEASQIAPRPDIESSKKTDYILGVTEQDKKLILILDLAKTLSVEDKAALRQAAAKAG